MWCQFHELIYQEFPVGIPRRFFLCEELLYTWHSTTTKFFFWKKDMYHTKARQERVLCSSNVLKKRKEIPWKTKKIYSVLFFTFQKKCFSHHLPLGPRSALVFKKEVMHE